MTLVFNIREYLKDWHKRNPEKRAEYRKRYEEKKKRKGAIK